MKPRKAKDIQKVLKKKGFVLDPDTTHHKFYYLHADGVKQAVYTYISHGEKEYGKSLMGQVKSQLKFDNPGQAEDFFDCPMTADQYVEMLRQNGTITALPPPDAL